jgi:hypothetical protein
MYPRMQLTTTETFSQQKVSKVSQKLKECISLAMSISTSGKVKQVYSKDALVKSIRQARKFGKNTARSAIGKPFGFRNAIPITTSPKRFQKLVSHLSDLPFAQASGRVDPQNAVLGYFGANIGKDWFKMAEVFQMKIKYDGLNIMERILGTKQISTKSMI